MRRAAIGLGAALLAIGVWRLRAPEPARPVAVHRAAPVAPAHDPSVVRDTDPPLPPALEGTSPDGALETDDTAHLVVSLRLRQFFDYFLIASGEEPRVRLRARIIAAIHERLAEPAADEARAILDRYLAYRTRVRRSAPDLRALHALRWRVLGPEVAEAFFGVEEAAATVALERRAIAADPGLSAAEQESRLAALEERLPEPVRAARAEAVAPLRLLHEEEALRASGASVADIQALREQTVGREAAARLAALDRERGAWQARLDDYRIARAAIDQNPTLDTAGHTRAIDALRAARFTAPERLRVAALDRAAGLDR